MKSILCIITLFAACAANVYAHGTCQHFHGRYFKIIHFTPGGADDQPRRGDDGKYQHGHRQEYLSTVKTYAWAYFSINYDDPANFDISDWTDYVDCPAVVPGTNGIPNPDPNKVDDENLIDPGEATNPMPVVRPQWNSVYSSKVEPDELVPLPKQQYVAPIKPIVKFNLELPVGYSFQHIPILTHITSVRGLLGLLGDSVIEIYADSPDPQPGGILSSAKYEEVLWASVTPGHGFIINMKEPVEIELSGVVVDIDYYLDTGYKLVGLGLNHAFDTVGDLSRSGWNNIDAIGGHGDLYYYAWVRVPADEIIVPSRDDKANPATAYLVYVNNVTAAAPGVIREPLNIATTWGGLKSGKLY